MPKEFNGYLIQEEQQVYGATMVSLVEGVGKMNPRFREIYQHYDFNDIDPNKWYSLIQWVEALHEIYQQRGGSIAISKVAKLIPMHAQFPAELVAMPKGIEPLEAVVMSWDMVYKMNQTGEVGGYEVQSLPSTPGKRSWIITESVPFPPEIGLGVGYGFCTRFLDLSKHTFKVFNNVAQTGMRGKHYVTEIWLQVAEI